MVADPYDVAVDFMDLTDEGRLGVRPVDARSGLGPALGRHVVVGDEGADPRVARMDAVDADGNLELAVLDGSAASHPDALERP